MTNYIARGRQVVLPLTNKSAGSVAAGDTVVLSSGTAASFTTTTSAGQTDDFVGVVYDATIAQDAIGLVIVQGFVPLITLSSSASLGDYVKTHSVAKQAAPSATRGSGSFGQVLGTGTTPAAFIWGFPDPVISAGNVATDAIWDAAGDLAVGTGANTAAKLTKGATGTVPTAGASTLSYAFPPGYEFNYAEYTGGDVTITGTSEGAETSIIASGAVTYDGSTIIMIHFFCPRVSLGNSAAARGAIITLYEDATVIGRMGLMVPNYVATQGPIFPVYLQRRRTPSNASHTYTVKCWKSNSSDTVIFNGEAGGSGISVPLFIRITKV